MIRKITVIAMLMTWNVALADSYTDMIFFGDSNTDNGRFFYIPQYTTGPTANQLAITGRLTTPGGLMWSEYLGARYGVTVTPSAAPGGGNNYAASSAVILASGNADNGENAWSADQQITSYLSSVNGRANASILYTLDIGTNDLKRNTTTGLGNIVDPQSLANLNVLALQTTALAVRLSNAGVRYLLVPNIASAPKTQAAAITAGFAAWTQTWADSLAYYNQAAWNGIAAQGIRFIPADLASLGDYVLLNPARFGITNTNITTPACGAVYAGDCTSADLVDSNAMNTYFFADTNGHSASVGQKIHADYVYGLLTAPVQVSMLANQASIGQLAMNNAYLDQIAHNFRVGASNTVGAWALGGAQQINMTDTQTSTRSSPYNGAVGMDYQYNEHLLLGGFVGHGRAKADYNASGSFTQSGTTLGTYVGYRNGAIWVNGLAAYNILNTNTNRVTPIGITSFSNAARVNGDNATVALQTGCNFDAGVINHGPIIGYSYVHTHVNGFTESGNFNSLQFASQNINAHVGLAGYQVKAKIGDWLPFAKASYNSKLVNLDREVTTTLTTVSAPSYSMPAMSYGRNWANLTAGISYHIAPKTMLQASFTQQISQQSVNSYNAAVSLNTHF